MDVDRGQIEKGLRSLGLGSRSPVMVHSSLRSFGAVDGGAETVAEALVSVCATVVVPSGTWDDHCGLPCPPGLERPNNSASVAQSWEEFDAALAAAVPYSLDLPIDKELGRIPETVRTMFPHARTPHPLVGVLAVGPAAEDIVGESRLDWPLGPLEVLERLNGYVLLLGVDHTTNTTIHLAEQRLGRSRFHRYAKAADVVWMELPNVPGQSHRFNEIEPWVRGSTRETLIGTCRARLIPARDLLAAATAAIEADPGALLCDEADCRCGAARRQREAWLSAPKPGGGGPGASRV